MNLRNKKTGEIVEFKTPACMVDEKYSYQYGSLAELNAEWEDVSEEPKEYWYIFGTNIAHTQEGLDELYDERNKEIGNYFETEEEAEKAVEKLKAITRLNKCGFRFEGYTDRDRSSGGDIIIYAHVDIPNNNLLEEAQPDMLKDLDLLFGSKE